MAKIVKLVGVLVLAFVLTGCDKIEIYKQYWDKDEKILSAELTYKKAYKSLAFRVCGENVSSYKQILGKAKCYFKNGQLSHEAEFVDNGKGGSMKVGIERVYYDNGQIKFEHPYNEKGEKDGVAKYWYKNGEPALELSYKNGKRDGMVRMSFKYNGIPKAIEFKEIPKESDNVDMGDYDLERGWMNYLDKYGSNRLPNYREL